MGKNNKGCVIYRKEKEFIVEICSIVSSVLKVCLIGEHL